MSFLGRLPSAMAPLGLITLVVQVTGSYARAGAVTAALGIGAAAGGPVVGFLSDRIGQRAGRPAGRAASTPPRWRSPSFAVVAMPRPSRWSRLRC